MAWQVHLCHRHIIQMIYIFTSTYLNVNIHGWYHVKALPSFFFVGTLTLTSISLTL